ncbi:MAG: SGNH/GDSL hydrolase family protein [Alphaproteobacteria bacterium]|nr:SGNH/GDSL hydrolase family protein [Alphaproteobacteria bacterium]
MKKLDKTTFAAMVTGLLTATMSAYSGAPQANKDQPPSPPTEIKHNPAPSDNITVTPKVLNVGDSRTVGMYLSENKVKYSNFVDAEDADGNLWFAKVGQGYRWFAENLNSIKNRADDCNAVVINLGVNDLSLSANSKTAADKYIKQLNELAAVWTAHGKKVFFSSANPVGPQYKHSALFNQKIDAFNRQMKEGLSPNITFIDTNSFIKDKLQAKDFDAAGLHYVPTINRSIHNFIATQIAQTLAKANGNYHMLTALKNQKTEVR